MHLSDWTRPNLVYFLELPELHKLTEDENICNNRRCTHDCRSYGQGYQRNLLQKMDGLHFLIHSSDYLLDSSFCLYGLLDHLQVEHKLGI